VEKPIEDDDEDLRDYEPPPGPSPREVRRRWVEEGNIDPFLDLIRKMPWSMVSVGEQLRNLQMACEVKARKDPAAFSEEVFSRVVAFNAFLVLRTQLLVAERVVGRGELPSTPAIVDLSNDVTERLLPRLVEMQRGLAEILVAQAKAARAWGLARAKEAQADRAVATGHEPPRGARSSGGKPARSGPRAATAARAEGPRDGVVPLPARGRRRG